MIKNLSLGMLVLLFASDSSSKMMEMNEEEGSEYELVFSDEFNQSRDSRPDTSKWIPCRRYQGHWSRWISDSRDVAFVKRGRLVCRAIPNRSEPGDTATMLTGAIETRSKFAFQYGKIEVRMRTNLKQGNFPAAWLVPTYKDGDKRYGEIDIVEMFGNQSFSFHTVHSHRSYSLKKRDIPMSFKKEIAVTGWHVYGVIWTKDCIVWTVDGEKVGEYRKIRTKQMDDEGQWTFDRPFYIRLNQSVGDGTYHVMIPHTDDVYQTEFDWVRVYQQKGSDYRR
jgi:beta-glucanase (GH16 family)